MYWPLPCLWGCLLRWVCTLVKGCSPPSSGGSGRLHLTLNISLSLPTHHTTTTIRGSDSTLNCRSLRYPEYFLHLVPLSKLNKITKKHFLLRLSFHPISQFPSSLLLSVVWNPRKTVGPPAIRGYFFLLSLLKKKE